MVVDIIVIKNKKKKLMTKNLKKEKKYKLKYTNGFLKSKFYGLCKIR